MDAGGIIEPVDGMEFETHEDAYSYYKEYARSVGFGTAKSSSRRSRASKEFIDAKFSCIRYGNKQQSDDAINPRPSPKIGCKASMHVKRRNNGKWYVYSFVKEHNHELLPDQAHFFRSHRNADPVVNDVRVRKRKSIAAGSKEFTAYRNVEFLENYMRNQNDRGRSLSLEGGDAQMLLELFILMQEENPKFFYAVDLNEEHRLRNVFWVDAKGVDDYPHFCDVVSVDMTYFTYKYKLPLVLFIGVNHHIQPTLLGCALVADETLYTFVWLMQTWLISMGGRAPRMILTDHNDAIKTAVEVVLPATGHCFCLWYILDKIPKKLAYASPWHDSFLVKFKKCIFKSWTEEQFGRRWWKLLEKFNLRDNLWVQSLYRDRRQWVPCFIRDVSFAGLSAVSRSDSLNALFDKYIGLETSMKEFLEQYKIFIEDRYEEEAKANFDAWHETPELKSPSPFEKQMLLVYTHEIFQKFQVEILGAAACHLKRENEEGTVITYSVDDFEDSQAFMVEWDQSKLDIRCSCHSFEYKGYLCRHAIVVLQMSGVFSIPSKYVLQRWTNTALSRHAIGDRLDEVQSKVRRLNDLCRRAIILGEEGSLSQESYNMALCAIKEALKQCENVNNSNHSDARSRSSMISAVCGNEEEGQGSTIVSVDKMLDPSVTNGKAYRRVDVATKKGGTDKVSAEQETCGTRDGSNQRVLSNMRTAMVHHLVPVHSMVPVQLHNVVSYPNAMSTQYHSISPIHLQEKHLTR